MKGDSVKRAGKGDGQHGQRGGLRVAARQLGLPQDLLEELVAVGHGALHDGDARRRGAGAGRWRRAAPGSRGPTTVCASLSAPQYGPSKLVSVTGCRLDRASGSATVSPLTETAYAAGPTLVTRTCVLLRPTSASRARGPPSRSGGALELDVAVGCLPQHLATERGAERSGRASAAAVQRHAAPWRSKRSSCTVARVASSMSLRGASRSPTGVPGRRFMPARGRAQSLAPTTHPLFLKIT